jgi:hypothetical protein
MNVPASPPPPPLRDGDRLTRAEFERRYEARPDIKKAELIEGVVYIPSPVNHVRHAGPHAILMGWAAHDFFHTAGVELSDNGTLRLDEDNEYQPNAMMFLPAISGAQAIIDADGSSPGAPELAAEVSASRVAIDLGPRLNASQRNGVREYLVWRVEQHALDWFVLRAGRYELLPGRRRGGVPQRGLCRAVAGRAGPAARRRARAAGVPAARTRAPGARRLRLPPAPVTA